MKISVLTCSYHILLFCYNKTVSVKIFKFTLLNKQLQKHVLFQKPVMIIYFLINKDLTVQR